MQRSFRRNMVKNKAYSSEDNRDYNRRRFHVLWQKLQVRKFGDVRKYLIMRIHKKARRHKMRVTILA